MKYILTGSVIAGFLTFFTQHLNAQSVKWAKQFTGSDQGTNVVTMMAITTDSKNHTITTGSFGGTIDFDPGSDTLNFISGATNTEIFISKLDTNGNHIWGNQISHMGPLSNIANSYSIVTDSMDNIYITGYISGSFDFDPDTGVTDLTGLVFSHDVFVAKYDLNGQLRWAKQVGGNSLEIGQSVAVDAKGNVYITGFFYGSADFDPGAGADSLTSLGNKDAFILKLDSLGNLVWVRHLGGPHQVIGNEVVVDGSGYVYTTGIFSGLVDFDPGIGTFMLDAGIYNNIFISKLDSSGNYVWARQLAGNSDDQVKAMQLDHSGNLHITGLFRDSTDFDPGPAQQIQVAPGVDGFLAKYDTAGHFLWVNQISGNALEYMADLAIDQTGDIYVSGHIDSAATFSSGVAGSLAPFGGSDAFIAKFKATGDFTWVRQTGGTSYDRAFAIAVDGRQYVHYTGHFEDTADFDPGPAHLELYNVGSPDGFISVLQPCLPTHTTYDTLMVNACDSFLSPNGHAVWTTSGIYFDTTLNTRGCDSLILIDLTINHPTTDSMTITTCDSFVSPSGHYIWTTDGIYKDTLPNAAGCDSVITLDLTINYTKVVRDSPVACYSYLSPSGHYIWTGTGIYYDTIPTGTGCDSLWIINLTINDTTSGMINDMACHSYVSPSGSYVWTNSGTYKDTLPNAGGCDSFVTIHLTAVKIDTSVTQAGARLRANDSLSSFQWLDCNNGFTPVSGATHRTFHPVMNGSYRVELTQSGCTDSSACFTVNLNAIPGNRFDRIMSVYPNPFTDYTIIDLKGTPPDHYGLEIFDLSGNRVKAQSVKQGNRFLIRAGSLSKGLYFFRIREHQQLISEGKLVIQ